MVRDVTCDDLSIKIFVIVNVACLFSIKKHVLLLSGAFVRGWLSGKGECVDVPCHLKGQIS